MDYQKLQLTGGSTEKRRELDYYPTPSEVTIALMEFLKLKPCKIWECCCGDYAMSKVLEQYGHDVVSTDIKYGQDYLTIIPESKPYAIITNPPFNISRQIIEKALQEADLVAMVLKSQYWHSKNRFDLFDNNKPAWVLPLTWRPDFLNKEKGGVPTMEVLWTVWIKGDNVTKYQPLLKPRKPAN